MPAGKTTDPKGKAQDGPWAVPLEKVVFLCVQNTVPF